MAVDLLSEQEVALAPLFAQSFHSATYVSIFFRKKSPQLLFCNEDVVF